jgi:Rieske Fe-S protein
MSRRSVLVLGAAGASTVALAACSKAKTSDSTAGGAGTASPGSKALAKLSDIKVGGAIAATGASGGPIIIARPTDTTVVAFSAICKHLGCTVNPGDTKFVCPCHGSTYDAKTGDRLSGPASSGLDKVGVKVSGEEIVPA